MKKWKEFTRQEKIMVGAIILLVVAIWLSWERISTNFDKGMQMFYNVPADTLKTNP